MERQKAMPGLLTRIPLRWRLALITLGLLTVLLGGLGGLISVTEEQTLLANQAVTLHNEARLALNTARDRGFFPAPRTGATPPTPLSNQDQLTLAAADLTQRLASGSARATVFAPDGSILASSEGPFAPPAATLPAGALQAAETTPGSRDSYLLTQDSTGQRELVVLIPLQSQGVWVATLELSTPTAPIDRAIATTRLILALGILGALVLAAALTLPLVSAALRPLVAMDKASRQIAEGALSLRLEEPPARDEIGRLAHSFNQMVAQLEESFAQQKRFVADAAHELRTPLTSLGGGLEMLLLGADGGDAEAAGRLERSMYAEVERMRRLVEDLLTLTRLDEGRANLSMTLIDVGALVTEVGEQVKRLAQGQETQCEAPPGLPQVYADPDRLRQVLLNLSENALKFTPPPGMVALSAWEVDGGWVEIAVRDSGVGIAAEALPHVFERFYRADPSRSRSAAQPGGSGLGLAIAKRLIEAQGGQIAIESAVGAGTTVTIRLRAGARAVPAATGEAARATPETAIGEMDEAETLPAG